MTIPENLLALFAARCAQQPGAPAVVDGTTTRTYAQLDAEAAAYAQALVAEGVGPEDVIPVVAVRCGQYVAMLLGVLRAGAAFLPLDPETPVRRARDMCDGVRAPVLLVQPGHERYATDVAGGDRRIVTATSGPGRAPAVRRDPDGLAYVIFTSGSTGTPKGAMVTDAGLANHTAAKTIDLAIGPDDAVGFTAPLSFDISVWQALTALTVGARVVVASPVDMSEPVETLAWVRRHGVTLLELVPSYMAVLLDELEIDPALRESLGTLRHLIATGEALPLPLARRWYTHCPRIALVNAYGPTECSDDVTHHIVTAAQCEAGRPPSIGREIINTRIHLVGDDGSELPPGVDGELFVGGDCVGRGYYADPVRTALAFVPDHLSGTPGARLYRTGDRARRAADGTIDFLGRRDRQVKLRGQRVELGEIEAELARVPGVATAAAVFVRDRVYGFVTPRSATDALRHDAVLDAVRSTVPGFLVPHEVTVLDRMPINTSGKTDYSALLRRVAAAADAEVAHDPAADALTVDRVCAVVAEVLGVSTVGADEHFFTAGGDSLMAMRLMSLARERFGVTGMTLRDFLTDPTPRRLLAAVHAAQAEPEPEPPVEAVSSALSSGQQRLWFLEQLHPSRYVQLIRLRLDVRGPLDLRALEHALNVVIERHEPLRTTFVNERGKPAAVIAPHAKIQLEMVTELPDPLDTYGLSARADVPPLLRAQVVRRADDDHVLNMVLHHLVADGFSIGVLGEELGLHYRRHLAGDVDAPSLASTYSRYVADEHRWLSGPDGAACERFWREELAGAPHVMELPFTRPHPDRPTFVADHVERTLTPESTTALREMARRARVTPMMVVTAAFAAVLRSLTGSDDLVLGIDSANRSWPGSESLIGTFVNQLPVRLRCAPGQSTLADLLPLVRRQSLAAYAHDRLPFHKIVAAVNPPRRAGRFPLFQVKVTHQGAWRDALNLPGLSVEADVLSEPVTDLDLMLDVSGEHDRLRLELVYRPEVLDATTAGDWLTAVATAVEEGVADVGAAPVSPLADDERRDR
ncbi:amino acid adenylation domain-containing protein [Micromonospora sp. NPDC047467]|uniref:amino acid adenylation domain-containing protein n=1 Tax=Micromonospora sp. NPDC047467 TaxID=3154814 RepID=UPI0033D66A2F